MDLSLVKFIVVIQLSTSIVFSYCYSGSLTTDQFAGHGDIWYDSPWLKLPIELQKYLPIIIGNAQRPKVYDGFGIIDLNLAAFTKVYYVFEPFHNLLVMRSF